MGYQALATTSATGSFTFADEAIGFAELEAYF
jgi:hypothetical protein